MTSIVATRRSHAGVAVAGLLLLTVRADVAHHTGGAATPLLIGLFGMVALAGLVPPLPAPDAESDTDQPVDPVPVLLIGLIAFAAGRTIGGGHPLLPATTTAIGLNTLAAVAEEAFFRRLLFGLLLVRSGSAAAAIAGSAVLFAVIHVPVYGWWVVPIDLAAGLVLGWQRSATGSWLVPAASHAAANLLVVL